MIGELLSHGSPNFLKKPEEAANMNIFHCIFLINELLQF